MSYDCCAKGIKTELLDVFDWVVKIPLRIGRGAMGLTSRGVLKCQGLMDR